MMGAKRNATAQSESRKVYAKGSFRRQLVTYQSMIEIAHAKVTDLITLNICFF